VEDVGVYYVCNVEWEALRCSLCMVDGRVMILV